MLWMLRMLQICFFSDGVTVSSDTDVRQRFSGVHVAETYFWSYVKACICDIFDIC